MTHFCSDRVTHRRRRAFVRKPKIGKAISSPPKAGCWVRFREQSRVISRECRSFFAYDPLYRTHNLLIWNYSPKTVRVTVEGAGVPERLLMRPELLDATAPSYDENARLRPLDPVRVEKGNLRTEIDLDSYGIAFWSFEPTQ